MAPLVVQCSVGVPTWVRLGPTGRTASPLIPRQIKYGARTTEGIRQDCACSSSAGGAMPGLSGGCVKRSGFPNGSRSAQSVP